MIIHLIREVDLITKFLTIAHGMLRLLYVRVMLIGALSILSVPLAMMLGDLIPVGLADQIGAAAVDPILQTLATSMLAVTTFSLTVMTGAYRTAWSQWGPRTHVILKDDTATHSVLSVFVGAFIFSMFGMVLRRTPFFAEQESVALFALTLLVIVLIVVSIIRWIAHLENLGSFDETLAQVERRVAETLRGLAREPCKGANALTGTDMPSDNLQPIRTSEPGYVQQIYVEALQDLAEQADARVFVTVSVGDYVQDGQQLAVFGSKNLPGDIAEQAESAFAIKPARNFVQDPLFGLSVLGDMACRALSPGINDPSSAVTVIDRLSSLLLLASPDDKAEPAKPRLDRVWLYPLAPRALFAETFDRIARDGETIIEVQRAIQRALAAIEANADEAFGIAARDCADRSMERGLNGLKSETERNQLRAART
ncbi:DUF2254 domain-containing protein [Ruegeria marina]|uniref:Uncharacterized membrane protein n=1 Tax=Ruegeria marina TaxID=639004 RepID=A0A1G6JFY5_9RHOB|nr:DUF2254 domain-containing protein [Ruegeria marina]SDC17573.1 Uncharacterized membrane protein [Ruegeria marina]